MRVLITKLCKGIRDYSGSLPPVPSGPPLPRAHSGPAVRGAAAGRAGSPRGSAERRGAGRPAASAPILPRRRAGPPRILCRRCGEEEEEEGGGGGRGGGGWRGAGRGGRPSVPLAGLVSEGSKTMGSDVLWVFIDST